MVEIHRESQLRGLYPRFLFFASLLILSYFSLWDHFTTYIKLYQNLSKFKGVFYEIR